MGRTADTHAWSLLPLEVRDPAVQGGRWMRRPGPQAVRGEGIEEKGKGAFRRGS